MNDWNWEPEEVVQFILDHNPEVFDFAWITDKEYLNNLVAAQLEFIEHSCLLILNDLSDLCAKWSFFYQKGNFLLPMLIVVAPPDMLQ